MRKKLQGITLLELLITIGIFSILATVLVFAINPVKRFQDSRDLARWSDVNAILSAIKIDKINNFGNYMVAIKSIPIASSSEVFMITDGGASSGCDSMNAYCDTPVTDANNCIDLSELVTKSYLLKMPISANGAGHWSASSTGYTLQKSEQGYITISACESEDSNSISVKR